MGPVSTGLGEIVHYAVDFKDPDGKAGKATARF